MSARAAPIRATPAADAASPGSPFRFTTLAHAGRDWLGPVDATQFAAVIAALPAGPATIVDIGCGKGAMLAELLQRHPDCIAIGVEPNPAFADAARRRFERAGVSERVTLLIQPLANVILPPAAFDLVLCAGATHAFGSTGDACAGAARLARPGAHVLIGEGHWRRTPDPGYLAVLGCEADAHATLPGTIALAETHGLSPLTHAESTPAEWDAYEESYAAAIRGWATAHPGDPDAAAFTARIARWTEGRERWGRDTLGFALHLFRVPIRS